jgi:hypothetical protein
MWLAKDPEEKLEQLRRSSLAEFEHLKAAQIASRKLSDRDMPEHSAMPVPRIYSTKSPSSEPPIPKPSSLSPSLPLQQQQYPSISSANAADIQNQTSTTGQPLFTEPDFNESVEVWRSPGAFSADGAAEADAISPTER